MRVTEREMKLERVCHRGRRVALLLAGFCGACSNAPAVGDEGVAASTEADGGETGALQPSDIPAEAYPADAASDCPAMYRDGAPRAGLNVGFTSAEQEREFFLMLPGGASEEPRPVLIGFNGTGEDGPRFAERAQLQDFVDRGFVVIAPSSNGNGTVWPVWDAMRTEGDESPNADLQYFDELLRCVAAHVPVDRNRIYVTGHSAGGIMANYVLQRRSELLAGGIVASGVMSLTSPTDAPDLAPMFVLVTWGGPSDGISRDSGSTTPQVDFVEQASLASTFYAAQPQIGHANCNIDIGHKWLAPLNDYMAQLLLQHPKGLPGADGIELPPVAVDGATCTTEPFEYDSGVELQCPPGAPTQCQAACQMFADCAVQNGTISSVLAAQLEMIGFSGAELDNCDGCVTNCGTWASESADAAVLSCFAEAQATAMCGPGVEGAQPLIDAVNDCCEGQTESGYCREVCAAILSNEVAVSFFPGCEGL